MSHFWELLLQFLFRVDFILSIIWITKIKLDTAI